MRQEVFLGALNSLGTFLLGLLFKLPDLLLSGGGAGPSSGHPIRAK